MGVSVQRSHGKPGEGEHAGGVGRHGGSSTLGAYVRDAALVGLFSWLLFIAYRESISPDFAYAGLTFRSPDAFSMAVAVGVSIAVCWALPRRVACASDWIIWVLFIGVGLPSMQLPQYMRALPVDEALTLCLVVAGSVIFIRVGVAWNPLPGSVSDRTGRGVWLPIGALAALIYVYVLATVGLSFRYLSFDDVYDVRSEFAVAAGGAPFIGYLLPLLFNVLNPALMAKGIISRYRLLVLASVGGQVVLYLSVGQKHILFGTIVVLFLGVAIRRRDSFAGVGVLVWSLIASAGAVVLDAVLDSIVWTSLVVRRFLVVPGALTAGYVFAFADQPREYFAKYLPFIDSPYSIAPSYIVGEVFIGNGQTNANASFLGHGFFNAGYIGIFVEACVIIVMLWCADSASVQRPLAAVCMVFFMPAIALTNGSPFTAILSSGFGAAVLLLLLIPPTAWSRAE